MSSRTPSLSSPRIAFAKYRCNIGSDFCEVHHINPLSETNDQTETSLDDLAIVCSNCHRMIHRIKPAPSIDEFKSRFSFGGTTK
ncbi:HNH endonuclease [uncultured Citrobacter sp.]|uniref:HNH endonuclease n=1 Tax=uncultured Citrobacter sp. TaxID=200446 RepID=UPI00338FA9D7